MADELPVTGIKVNGVVLAIDDDKDITLDGDKLSTGGSGEATTLDTTNFDNNLDDTIDNVQKLADALDDMDLSSSGGSSSGGGPLPKFDTEEVLTARRWINGKPLYHKVIDFGTLPNDDVKEVAHNIEGAEYVNINEGFSFIYRDDDPTTWPVNYNLGDSSSWRTYASGDKVIITTESDRTSFKAYLVVEYTKTDDDETSPVTGIGGSNNVVQTHLTEGFSQALDSGETIKITDLSAKITPASTNSRIKIEAKWNGESTSQPQGRVLGLMANDEYIGNPDVDDAGSRYALGIAQCSVGYYDNNNSSTPENGSFIYMHSPATTDEITYEVTMGNSDTDDVTLYTNRTVKDSDSSPYERLTSTIILTEIV
jgi:hypothetical protein